MKQRPVTQGTEGAGASMPFNAVFCINCVYHDTHTYQTAKITDMGAPVWQKKHYCKHEPTPELTPIDREMKYADCMKKNANNTCAAFRGIPRIEVSTERRYNKYGRLALIGVCMVIGAALSFFLMR